MGAQSVRGSDQVNLPDEVTRWCVRRDHLTSAAGAPVLAWKWVMWDIGILPNGKAGRVQAPPDKVLTTIRYRDGEPATIILFFPKDFEQVQQRERKQLRERHQLKE